MKEKKIIQTFFDQKAENYHKFAHGERSKEVREKIKQIIDEKIQDRVIDLGGGGEIHYEVSKAKLFVSFDISQQSLKKVANNQYVYAVCGDAENLPFKNNVFDVALCRCFIHHLVKENTPKSNDFLLKILSEIFEVMDKRGKIIVVENCLPKIFEKIENFLFVFSKKILESLGKPTVRFLSSISISNLLKGTGFVDIQVTQMKEKKSWRFVLPGIILPFFKIPEKLVPTTHHIIMGRKP